MVGVRSRWGGQMVVMVMAAVVVVVATRRHLLPATPSSRLSGVLAVVARALLQEELRGCFLTLIGGGHEATQLLAQLAASLHVPLQVNQHELNPTRPPNITWVQSSCDAFLVTVEDVGKALEYLKGEELPWNYRGRYLFFGASCVSDLLPLVTSDKMAKTEHALFVCGGRAGGLEVRTHWLYSLKTWSLIGHATLRSLNRESPFFPPKLADLQGYPLVVKTFPFHPSVFGKIAEKQPDEGDEGETKTTEGVRDLYPEGGQDVSFIQLLAKHMNFTAVWRYPGPSLWGVLQDDGSYTGVVGQVGSGEGDIGVGNIFLDILRSRFATFSYPYTYEIACFITPAPQDLPPWISLGSPFLQEVWAALVVTFLGAGVLSLFIARVLDSPKDLQMFYSLGRWLVYTVGIVTCQSQQMPQTNRLRVASLCLQFMGFVVAISFSGNLTAFLTTRNVEPALRSLRQLDESGLAIVGFSNYWLLFFLASQNAHLLSFASKYRDVSNTLPVFREVAEQRTAALVENRNHLQYILTQFYTTKRGETPLRIQEECLATFGVSAALTKHSPLAPYINEAIHYMQAGGLTDKFFEEVLLEDFHHDDHSDEETWLDLHDQDTVATGAKVLSLEHLLGAFVVMAAGFLIASLSLAVERCCLHSH